MNTETHKPLAWMHEDGRVVRAETMEHARQGGGAMLSSLAGYTIPLYGPDALAAERERCAKLVEDGDTSGHDGYIETTGDLLEALAGCIRRGA